MPTAFVAEDVPPSQWWQFSDAFLTAVSGCIILDHSHRMLQAHFYLPRRSPDFCAFVQTAQSGPWVAPT